MNKKKFDDTEIEEYKLHQNESPVDINKIVVSNNKIEIYSDDENSKEMYSDDSYNEDFN